MIWDFLVIEIGSTITKVNGFHGIDGGKPEFGKKGFAPTTVDTSVMDGVEAAKQDFLNKNNITKLDYGNILINSSAAGGLKMIVIGLTYDMTANAAKEAALGAGAVLKYITAGQLKNSDLKKICEISPNLILLCGGVDYGEDKIIINNANELAKLNLHIPLIFAGNVKLQDEIRDIFKETNYKLYITENVFPGIDELNIDPAKILIQKVFTEHIIKAKGMEKLKELTKDPILPTPGAVMNTIALLAENGYEDILALDVGGATTDVYSVTDGSDEYRKILVSPEPKSKRTVEGDLGVYINADNIIKFMDDKDSVSMETVKPLPQTNEEKHSTNTLCKTAVKLAVARHAGILKSSFESFERRKYVKGKDLTAIKWIAGTGGVLSSMDNAVEILNSVKTGRITKSLLPPDGAKAVVDSDYIFSSVGMLAKYNPSAALKLAERSMFNNIKKH